MMIKKLPLPLLSLLLVLGYLVFNKKALYLLVQRVPPVPQNISLYKQAVRNESDKYAATNIFDKGYVKEESSKLNPRLSVSPEDTPLERGCLIIRNNSSESIVKIALPEGFRHGILRLYNQAASEYSIGISYDLDNWKFSHYPGYLEGLMSIVNLKKGESANEAVYIKFIPESNESLNVCFSEFQYTSSLPNDIGDYRGFLFIQDIEVDYDGKVIKQPTVVIHEK